MPKLTVSIDGLALKDIELTQERTTLGRRPYNDVVIDNLAVSGEHAVLWWRNGAVEIEDLASTNGTYVNGRAIRSAVLQPDDLVEIGRYKLRLVPETAPRQPALPQVQTAAPSAPAPAHIRVLNGPAAGRDMPLVKVVTTVGKPGVSVASITQRAGGYTLARVDGPSAPTLNGQALGNDPVPLAPNDVIELAGTQMRFEQD